MRLTRRQRARVWQRAHLRFLPAGFWRRVNEWEVFNIPVKIVFGIALYDVPAPVRRATPLFRHMNAIMPFNWWAYALWATVAAIIVGFVFDNLWLIRLSYAFGTAYWITVAVLTWEYAHTYIGLTFYAAFALATILRQGRIVWEERHAAAQARVLAERDAEIARLRAQLAGLGAPVWHSY